MAAPRFRLPVLASTSARVLGPAGAHIRARQGRPIPGWQQTQGGQRRAKRCRRHGAMHHRAGMCEVIRGGRRPQAWSIAPSGRRILRQREVGENTSRADQDSQDGGATADVALACDDRAGVAAGDPGGRTVPVIAPCRTPRSAALKVFTIRAARAQGGRQPGAQELNIADMANQAPQRGGTVSAPGRAGRPGAP